MLKESYAPPLIQEGQGGLIFPEFYGSAKVPPGAENYKLRLSGVFIDNGLEELAYESDVIASKLTRGVSTGVDLFNAATALEAIYARAGYVLVRVVLPQQTLEETGILKLRVVRGYIDNVDLSALPDAVARHIEPRLAHLLNDELLTQKKIERFLLLASDTPGFLMRSTLRRGASPGTTTLVVSGDYDRFSVGVGASNRNAAALGTYSVDLHSELNNAFGLGEAFYTYIGGHLETAFSQTPLNRQVAFGLTLPIFSNGSWVNLERVESRANPQRNQLLGFRDSYQKTSFAIGHHWLRSRSVNFNSSLSFKYVEEKLNSVLGDIEVPFSADTLSVAELHNSADFHGAFGYVSARFSLLQGLGGVAASEPDDLPMSRDGASADFKKLQGDIFYQQFFARNAVGVKLNAKVQSALGDVLPASERLAIDGANLLSAYTAGALTGDSGYAWRAEMMLPRMFASMLPASTSSLEPYVFFARGRANQEQPTALEERVTTAQASGVGLMFTKLYPAGNRYFRLLFEYAHGTEKNLLLEGQVRLSLTANL